MKKYYIYILASQKNGTLYLGVTNDLIKRIYQHRNNQVEGFSNKHNVHLLVYFEETEDVHAAILREKQMKKWNRAWKLNIIEKTNPNWNDLYKELL